MSVAMLIKFKAQDQRSLYLPMATEGTYSREWVSVARKLGLPWLPLFQTGIKVEVAALPAVMYELRQLRAALVDNPGSTPVVERIDSIIEALSEVAPAEIAEIFIG
ncbi:hypothetical protein F0U62_20685 [Cystobacter fuscus]|nr:hypothetical protein F0U62_20685 [Cystobacter fuscus]